MLRGSLDAISTPSKQSDTTVFLASGFLRSAESFPDRPALEIGGEPLSYRKLRQRAARLAATICRHTPSNDPPLTAVFAYRSFVAFEGVIGALLAGHGYVPLNRTFPPERTQMMLQRAGCRAVIVDSASAEQLDVVLEGTEEPLLLIFPEESDVDRYRKRWPRFVVLGASDLEPGDNWRPVAVDPNSVAYVLFTSGSTGIPKGVMVAHRNVVPFVEFMVKRYGITEEDRFSQMFDMTFDLSVFDMFVGWDRGSCVCCPSEKQLIQPGRFARESAITVWFSVPSTAVFMKRLGALKPGRYPKIRWSLFCGEPLPAKVAQAFAAAAPSSILENLYGPTEVTIACTLYRWNAESSPVECELGIVPIGDPYPGMSVLIVDDKLREVSPGEEEVSPGEEGELFIAGPQVTLGYWKDPEKTAQAFMRFAGHPETYYRTGDRVRAATDKAPMVYLGRVDHQIKIHGHRVELGEVEAVLRDESGVDAAIAVGWPQTVSGASGLVAFLGTEHADQQAIRERMAMRLPEYMVPREIRVLPKLPLNANGKFDRKALIKILESSE